MEFTNALYQDLELVSSDVQHALLESLTVLLAPMAPHLAEELWHQLGHNTSVHEAPWPQYNPADLVEEEVEVAIQVNGKVRARMRVSAAAPQEQLERQALSHPGLAPYLRGHEVQKVIVIPGRLINVVVG
jgi:leucyl-tRNA synthetase